MRFRLFTAFALIAAALPGTAFAAPTLSQFDANADATGIARGVNGSLWYTGPADPGSVSSIATDGALGRVARELSPNAAPSGIATGPGGVWVTETAGNKIARITPGGTVKEFPTGAYGRPSGIVAGHGSDVWFAATEGPGAIGRITPSGAVSEFTEGLTAGGAPQALTLGADGNVWFTLPGTQRIGRITDEGTITEFGPGGLSGTPRDITTGPDANMWFTEDGAFPAIGRITAAGKITEFTAGLPLGSVPTAITTGADGNLYVTDRGANAVLQVTPAGEITRYGEALPDGAAPEGITTGSDGRLWFAERGLKRIGRLTVAPAAGPTTATDVTDSTASLTSSVAANSEATTYHFEWGETVAYGQSSAPAPAGSASSRQPATTTLAGLAPDTSYHVRLVATNASGTGYGPDAVFTTLRGAAPPSSGETTTSPASKPVPTLNERAVASVVRGVIRVRAPGSARSTVLDTDAAIPSGSVIDARNGTIALKTVVDRSGRTQTARFAGTIFRASLSRRSPGFVDVHLKAKATGCASLSARRAAPRAKRSRRAKRPVRLWSKDRGGKYRTHGRDSVATVRGTEWSTTETCTGTLTRVMGGAVSVKDRRTGKRVLLRAGQVYLARHRK